MSRGGPMRRCFPKLFRIKTGRRAHTVSVTQSETETAAGRLGLPQSVRTARKGGKAWQIYPNWSCRICAI